MAHPTRRTLTATVVGACVGLGVLAVGCSDSGDEITVDPTTTESTSTTGSTTTTTESATTESTPTTLDDEAAIRELHEYFLTEVVARDEREVTLEEQVALLEDVAVDPLLSRATDARAGHYERGEYAVTPPGDVNIVEVQIEGDRATVIDCFLDSGVLYANDGTVLIPADPSHEMIEVVYEFRNGRWFVSDYYGGDEQCSPNA